MHGYEKDEYEDLDEYENDGTEPEEEADDEGGYEEEETFQPTQDELEYLELRKRLKESFTKQMKKELWMHIRKEVTSKVVLQMRINLCCTFVVTNCNVLHCIGNLLSY